MFACTTPPEADTDTLSAPGVPFTATVSIAPSPDPPASVRTQAGVDAGDVRVGQ